MRTRRGDYHPNAKLTTDKVYAILVWYWDDDMSQAEIARKLGVAECTVWNVIHEVSWKHVTNRKERRHEQERQQEKDNRPDAATHAIQGAGQA